MAVVKFSRVISCSSEDPKYPAVNLLKSEVSSCWKCKDAGEKQAVVILQLERTSKISSIDIGNENSAFIEIFVGKSAVPDTYEVLRVASYLMTVQEAKKGENKNVVRFFKYEEFNKLVADQSWDRIKITCTQPFNRQIQYGLSFVKVHSKEVAKQYENPDIELEATDIKGDDNSSQKEDSILGKFALKGDRESTPDVAVGSFFARRKDIGETLSAAASIRAASNNPSTKRLSDILPDLKDAKRKRTINDAENISSANDGRRNTTGPLLYVAGPDDSDSESEEADAGKKESNQTVKKETKTDKKNVIVTKNTPTQSPKTPRAKPSQPQSTTKKQPEKNVKRKPFGRLLEGVIFVISGFQNPYRSELRSKAISLGAKYKADWDSTCTHLICAFPNTPKAAVVKGKGWIIRKDWIEDCHSQRKKLSCQSYKLDKRDTYTHPNDEEIYEDIPGVAADSSDSPDEAERVQVKPLNNGSSPGNSPMPKTSPQKNSAGDDVFDVDTDIDSDSGTVPSNNHENVTLPVLPDFFSDKKFYFGTDMSDQESKMLHRYVVAYKGEVVTDVNTTHYIITEDTRYKDNIQNSPTVLPDWIWECNDRKALVPVDPYLV